MDSNSALVAAIRERLVSELSKSAPKRETTSIGVMTNDCELGNKIIRERILLELTKPKHDSSIRCNTKDVSIQTDKKDSVSNKHVGDSRSIEERLMEIENECENRLRREMNAKIRLSAKEQAMQAMAKLDRKHKDECRSLQKQLFEERSRFKQREKELLQTISKQQMSGQKELRDVEQKLERERLEKRVLESELGLLNDKMKEFQKTSTNNVEQHQLELCEAVREREKFKLLLANESEKHLQKTKKLDELSRKHIDSERRLTKTESALSAKNSEVTALRALLKQCHSTLESLSYSDEKSRNDCIHQKSTLSPTIIKQEHKPTLTKQEEQAFVESSPAAALRNNVIDKEQCTRSPETIPDPRNCHVFEKKYFGDPPPCSSLGDPPEEIRSQVGGEDLPRISVSTAVSKDIELDLCISNESSVPKAAAPLHDDEEQTKLGDASGAESGTDDNESYKSKHKELGVDNKGEKLSPDQFPSSTGEAEVNETTPIGESSSNDRQDESCEVNNDTSRDSESIDTDEYSMGSFCSVDHKLDKKGRVSFIHIK